MVVITVQADMAVTRVAMAATRVVMAVTRVVMAVTRVAMAAHPAVTVAAATKYTLLQGALPFWYARFHLV